MTGEQDLCNYIGWMLFTQVLKCWVIIHLLSKKKKTKKFQFILNETFWIYEEWQTKCLLLVVGVSKHYML